jgi:hypothetical protein
MYIEIATSPLIEEKVKDFFQKNQGHQEKRKAKFETNLNFVLNADQWEQDELNEREVDSLKSFVFNFSEDYLEKYLSRLFPRSNRTGILDVGVKVYEDDENKKSKFEQKILETYKLNKMSFLLLEQGTNFLVGGAGCIFYPLDPISAKPLISSLNPANVLLSFDSNNNLKAFGYSYLEDNQNKSFYYDKFTISFLTNNEITKSFKNDFGFIPFSWVPNFPYPHNPQLIRSKIDSLIPLDQNYNEVASNYTQRVAENTTPQIVAFSRSLKNANDISRGGKKKTLMDQDDDLRYLTLPENPDILNYLNLLSDKMKEKTGIVDVNSVSKSSQSGVSFSFQYSDMLDHVGFYRIFWDIAFRELNSAILTYYFGKADYFTDPIYNQALNFDENQRIEQYEKMLKMGVISRADTIDELRGAENPVKKLDEIEKEKKKIEQKGGENIENEDVEKKEVEKE